MDERIIEISRKIAAKANECCHISDGWEEEIEKFVEEEIKVLVDEIFKVCY